MSKSGKNFVRGGKGDNKDMFEVFNQPKASQDDKTNQLLAKERGSKPQIVAFPSSFKSKKAIIAKISVKASC